MIPPLYPEAQYQKQMPLEQLVAIESSVQTMSCILFLLFFLPKGLCSYILQLCAGHIPWCNDEKQAKYVIFLKLSL